MPWSAFWERNYFAASLPTLREILKNNFVRGAVSGLGIVNLSLGFIDLAILMSARRLVGSMGGREASPIPAPDPHPRPPIPDSRSPIGSGLPNEE